MRDAELENSIPRNRPPEKRLSVIKGQAFFCVQRGLLCGMRNWNKNWKKTGRKNWDKIWN